MRSYENETDPRILKELIRLIVADNEKKQILINKLLGEKEKVEQVKFSLEESFSILKKKFFGTSSERNLDRHRDRKNEDPEILLHSQNIIPPLRKKSTKQLNEEVVIHEASAEELKSASEDLGLTDPSEHQWEKVEGLFEQSTEVEIVERSYKRVIHKKQKYRLRQEYNQTEKDAVLITGKGSVKLLPGSLYSIPFAVATVIDKYLNHLPLERQCRMMDSLGLRNMSPQVLYNLSKAISIYLEPVVEQIKQEILGEKVVHSDETPWPITNNKDSDGYMWIVANNRGSYYRFEPTRSGDVVRESLSGFTGTILTDGYSGYYQFREGNRKNINQNVLAMCHAHARRYFFDIKEMYPIVEEYLNLYSDLFAVEKQARDFDELKKLREEKSKLIWEKMRKWLLEVFPKARGESKLKEAIEYSSGRWTELSVFLKDPYVPLTNNEAERTIRHAVMGRKNFYGSRSIDGADVAATIYSVIESCKKVELDPREYLVQTIRLCAQGLPFATPLQFVQSLRQ